ncbi:MAG: 6-phosphogluconolactonase [Cryobacterium sp.]|nr:6-phosphogluconolactonase [Cryobacterium sp.]
MSQARQVHVFEDRAALIDAIARGFIDVMSNELSLRDTVNVVLTGGSVGIDILAAIGASDRRDRLDWNRIHVWWGDERWLPAGDPERNDKQADDALLRLLSSPAANIHRFPASDGPYALDDAAKAYALELAQNSPPGSTVPRLDLMFLGVGPDGHIASLFPAREGISVTDATVIPVRNSPKPPPERLSLTLPVINSAARIWLCLAGGDKATALGLALAGANVFEVPVAGVRGRESTEFFVDASAAADIPEELVRNGAAPGGTAPGDTA